MLKKSRLMPCMLLLTAAFLTSGTAIAAPSGRCPSPPNPAARVIVVFKGFPADAKGAAEVAQQLDNALVNSKAINTEVDFLDANSGVVVGPCGFIDEPKLANNTALRRAIAINPMMQELIAKAHRGDAKRADMVSIAGFLSRYGASTTPTYVVIYAPMLRDNPADPGTSFRDGRYPSDGHLSAPGGLSLLSIVGRESRLKGLRIYLATVGDEQFINDTHRERVTRFWVNYFAAQGAIPVSVNQSLEASFGEALAREGKLGDSFAPKVDMTQKPLMLSVKTLSPPKGFLESSVVYSSLPTFNKPIDNFVGTMIVGLVWNECEFCDFDLYTAPNDEALDKEIFYARDSVPGVGNLTKRFDEGNPRRETRGYEWVTYENPVDIRQVSVWVNLYELPGDVLAKMVTGKNLSGEVRVRFNGGDYSVPFHMKASTGNRGQDRDDIRSRRASPYWVQINLQTLQKLAAKK